MKFTSKRPQAKPADHILCEPAQSKCTSTCHKSHFIRKFTGKMPQTKLADHTLCEPAQSKCMSVCHRSHFLEKFAGKMPQTSADRNRGVDFVRACAVERHVNISQELLYTEICRKNAGAQSEHPDQAPAFTLTVRYRKNPSVWTHCLGRTSSLFRDMSMSKICGIPGRHLVCNVAKHVHGNGTKTALKWQQLQRIITGET